MKASDLKQIIREVVKQEVAAEVNKQMVKLVAQIISETLSSKAKTIVEQVEPVQEETFNVSPLKLTGNSALDAALSTTKPFTREQRSEFAQLMTETFDKVGQGETATSEPKTKLDFLKQIVSDPVTQRPSVVDTVPKELKKLFNKDFRAILNKSKNPSGGIFNPSSVLSGDRQDPRSV
jgi:hypothetical protein